MSYRVITYSTKAETANENQRLIAGVFEGLRSTETDGNPITSLASFDAFMDRIEDRRAEASVHRTATIIGNYGLLQ